MSVTTRPPVTVSIVSHGQQSLVLPLLRQLQEHCACWIDKVVLTINVDEPDLVTSTGWSFSVELVRNPRPKGFGANHNAALAHGAGQWFLVLNPDIRVDGDVVGALLRQAPPRAGVLAPRIVEPGMDGPEPHRNLLTPCEILTRNWSTYHAPQQPAWIPGMFMLFRVSAFRQIRGFDTRYFMYGEDFDVCARLRLGGWSIYIGERLQVRHDARRASRKDGRHLRWHMASLVRVWLSAAFWSYRRSLRRSGRSRLT